MCVSSWRHCKQGRSDACALAQLKTFDCTACFRTQRPFASFAADTVRPCARDCSPQGGVKGGGGSNSSRAPLTACVAALSSHPESNLGAPSRGGASVASVASADANTNDGSIDDAATEILDEARRATRVCSLPSPLTPISLSRPHTRLHIEVPATQTFLPPYKSARARVRECPCARRHVGRGGSLEGRASVRQRKSSA
eukprot:4274253-Pleurochrysis_carterae.AAC.1